MFNDECSHTGPPSNLNSVRLSSHVSALERAFGSKTDVVSMDPETLAKAEELEKQAMKDRGEFIKLYQYAAMNYARGVLVKQSRRLGIQVHVEQDVPAVFSNLAFRLLQGKFKSFRHTGNEGSFRVWLRRVISNECKGYLVGQGRILGSKGPRNVTVIDDDIDPEFFDPEDRALETTLRGMLIKKAYETMEEAGLYGEAVLYWEKLKRKIDEVKDNSNLSIESTDQMDNVAEKSLVDELATHLSTVSGRPVSQSNAKKHLERGKDLFANNIIDQVAKYDGMIDREYDADRIEETLIELEFLEKQRTKRKGVSNTQFSRRLRRILDSLRAREVKNLPG
jgi:hypothetical protein